MRLRTIQIVAALSAAVAFVLAFIAAGIFIVSSLFMALGLAAIFAGLSHQSYVRLTLRFGGRRYLAAATVIALLVLIVVVPLTGILAIAIKEAAQPGQEGLVFINAWNEWAEGNHLEPCQKWGRAYLEATTKALEQSQP